LAGLEGAGLGVVEEGCSLEQAARLATNRVVSARVLIDFIGGERRSGGGRA
jgi:hypothetical protein